MAPLAVFFDASGTTSSATTRPFHELEYRWSFGETASGTWNHGAKAGTASRNEAMGPVAAHVFESPGTYPITVSAYDGRTTVSYSCNITVTPADQEFANTKTVCVSASGDFSGCPSGAVQVTSANPSAAVAGNIGAGNKRILFRRGERFDVASSISINRPGPGVIGAFGTGAKPVLIANTSNALISLSSPDTPTGVSDWRFQDIALNGNLQASGFVGAGSASRVLLQRVDLSNVGYGLLLSGSTLSGLNTPTPFRHALWDEFYVADSTLHNLIPGLGPNAVFGNGSRMVIIGSRIDNNLGGEHGIRMQLVQRGVFSHNTIQGIAEGKVNLTLRGAAFTGSNTVAPGTYSEKVVVSDNRLVGGASSGVMGIGPQNGFNDERGRNMLVERNWFVGSSTTQDFLTIAQSDITVRNNLIYAPSNNGGSFVTAKDEDPRLANLPTRIHVHNNSMYHASNGPHYFALFNAVPNNSTLSGSTFSVKNNLLYAPFAASAHITGNTSAAVIDASHNTPNVAVSPLFASNPPLAITGFVPASSGYGHAAGTPAAKVHSDFFGVPTPTTPGMGAIHH